MTTAPTYAALLTVGIMLATWLRAALTTDVPPSWFTLPAKWRPFVAGVAGGVSTALLAMQSGQGWQAAVMLGVGAMVGAAPVLKVAEAAAGGGGGAS